MTVASETFQIGDAPVVTITCMDLAGAVADPTGLNVVYKQPAGASSSATTTTYTYGVDSQLTKSSTGIYLLALPVLTRPGRHELKPTATGTNAASEQSAFQVERSNVV